MTKHWTIALLSTLALAAGTAAAQDRALLSSDRQGERSTLMNTRADRMEARQAPNDYGTANLSSPGKLSNFRQRRSGQDLWAEPETRELSYEQNGSVIEMSGGERIRQLDDGRARYDPEGDRASFELARDKQTARKKSGAANVRMLLSSPRKPDPADDY
jgi:lipopolysaccharide export system protein LptA